MKRTFAKSAPTFSNALLGASLLFCFFAFLRPQANAEKLMIEPQAADSQSSARSSSVALLKVHVLPTSDGGEPGGVGLYADRYPKMITLEHAAAFSDRISAYGAAYRVWIAPKSWTGSGAVGADGSTDVNLHSVKGSAKRGPRFHYENSGGCAGCAIDAAAPYFPNAMQQWKESFSYDTLSSLPRGLKIVRVSPRLLTYSFFDEHDLLSYGAASFDSSDQFFEKAEFVLPRTDVKFLNFLLRTFISTMKPR